MQRKIKTLLDFTKLKIPQKVEFARNVKNLMTGNANFPTPDVALTTITTDANALETHYLASRNGNHTEIAAMKASEKVLDNDLKNQARYIDRIAQGNESVILSSGFHASKAETTPTPLPDKPENFRATAGLQAGKIDLKMNKLLNADSFVFIITQNMAEINSNGDVVIVNAGPARILASTSRNVEIDSLQSGTSYQCKCFGISSAGKGPDSNIVNIVAP